MNPVALRRRRTAAQLLTGDTPGAAPGTVRHLLAVQAQDLSAARLALRARGAGDLDAALTDDHSLVVAWLLRGTLHLVAAEDHGWLHSLTAPLVVATCRRRLARLGVDESAVEIVERAVAGDGPLTRPELAARLEAAGVRADGQRTPHLIALAASRGSLVLGPLRGDGAHAYALTREWLGTPALPDRDIALAELARRYLRGHGPATAADLAVWSGLGLRAARAGLATIAAELVEEEGGLVSLRGRPGVGEGGPVARLLPAFDPYLLGWKDRSFAVAPEHARSVHPGGGIIRATMLLDGEVVGTWSRDRGRVRLAPFSRLKPAVATAFEREATATTA